MQGYWTRPLSGVPGSVCLRGSTRGARVMVGPMPSIPTVQGPVPGPARISLESYDLASIGYMQEEFFLSGVATAYELVGGRRPDGRCDVTPGSTAEYATRIVVRRPTESGRFNGVAVVEWFNVSNGFDVGPDWLSLHRHLVRDGFAWVGVSAQFIGVEGGAAAMGAESLFGANQHLKGADPSRYGTLAHPGDQFSFDIFSQAGRAVRQPTEAGVLGPLEVAHLLATGQSQSAGYLVTYINAIDPMAQVYDGYLVHGRGPVGVPLDGARRRPTETSGELIRGDVRVPVLTLQSETDALFGAAARTPDHERFRLWEVAGSAHLDTYTMSAAPADSGSLDIETLAALLAVERPAGLPTNVPVNSGPQYHYVGQAAVEHLHRWVRDGRPPPEAPRLEIESGPAVFRVDEHGNARGGVRTPWVDVPTALLSGFGQDGDGTLASLLGSTRPFSARRLAELYPGGQDDYMVKFVDARERAEAAGFLLAADGPEIDALAALGYRSSGTTELATP